MTEALVDLRLEGPVAVLALNDGKRNVLSRSMFSALNGALDRAERANAVVVLTGQPGTFSAGFDLNVLKRGGREAVSMLGDGVALSQRLLSFPQPVVIAVSGHAIAMAAFLLLCGDYRLGAAGDFKIVANEVAIGMPMPRVAIEICRQRLAPAHLTRALLLAETYDPEGAVAAGFLDRVIDPAALLSTAVAHAQKLAKLDMRAHAISKQRLRSATLSAMRAGSRADLADYLVQGARQLLARRSA